MKFMPRPCIRLTFDQFSDEESPLYEFSARDISSKMQFEIILTMEGITPETGNTIQVGCTTSQNQPNLKIRLENKMMMNKALVTEKTALYKKLLFLKNILQHTDFGNYEC